MLTDVMTVIIVIVSLYPAIVSVIICRFVGGVVFGINVSTIPIYIREVTPVSISGAMGSMF